MKLKSYFLPLLTLYIIIISYFSRESLTTPVDRDGGDGAPVSTPAAVTGGKYVPPSMRGAEGRIGLGDSMPDRRRDDTAAIR